MTLSGVKIQLIRDKWLGRKVIRSHLPCKAVKILCSLYLWNTKPFPCYNYSPCSFLVWQLTAPWWMGNKSVRMFLRLVLVSCIQIVAFYLNPECENKNYWLLRCHATVKMHIATAVTSSNLTWHQLYKKKKIQCNSLLPFYLT
jgi:hypothetical protein